MPTTVTDASLTTARRRQLTLFSWRNGQQYSYNPRTQKNEQAASGGSKGTGPTLDVVVAAKVGGALIGQEAPSNSQQCPCDSSVTLQGYVKQSPAQC